MCLIFWTGCIYRFCNVVVIWTSNHLLDLADIPSSLINKQLKPEVCSCMCSATRTNTCTTLFLLLLLVFFPSSDHLSISVITAHPSRLPETQGQRSLTHKHTESSLACVALLLKDHFGEIPFLMTNHIWVIYNHHQPLTPLCMLSNIKHQSARLEHFSPSNEWIILFLPFTTKYSICPAQMYSW